MKYLLSILFSFWSVCSLAKPLNQVVVFGDSLSDRGNLYEYMNHQLPMSPPYYEGRFTNGPVWIELLVKKLYPENSETHFLDYAYGGANVGIEDAFTDFSLQNQIQKYMDEHPVLNPDALYVMWAGSNNYLDLPEDIDATVNQVISGLGDSMESLIKKGAKNLFVVNVPDLSTTPAAIEFESQAELKQMSDTHNRLLAEKINAFKRKYPDVHILLYDVTNIMGDIIAHPENHGFKDGKRTCCEYIQENSRNLSVNPQVLKSKFLSTVDKTAFAPVKNDDICYDYLFFDLYHPTEHAHALMSEEIYKLLADNHFIFE
jgi:hypothetical protein